MHRLLALTVCLFSLVKGYTEDILDPSHIIGIEAIQEPMLFDADIPRRAHGGDHIAITGEQDIRRICEHLNKLEEHDWLNHTPYTDSEVFKISWIGWLVSYISPAKQSDLSLTIYYDDGRLPEVFWDSHYKSFRNKLYDADLKWRMALHSLVKDIGQVQTSDSLVKEWMDCKIDTDDINWIFFNLLPRSEQKHYDRSSAIYRLTTDFVKLGGIRGYLTDKTKIQNFLILLRNLPYRKTNSYSVLETGYQAGISHSEGIVWNKIEEDVLGFIVISRDNKVDRLEAIWINDNETVDRGYFNFGFTDEFKSYLNQIYEKTIFDPKPKGVPMPQWGKERQVN